jgi:hypothetical protein
MPTERKILYALGLLIIGGMIAIGAFSLGIYVGKSSWTLKQPALQSPQQGPGNIPNPDQGEPVNPPPKPDLVGKVISVTADTIEISTRNGLYSVVITEDTIYLQQGGGSVKPARLEDIQIGTNLAIIGKLSQDNRTLRGEIVVLLPGNQ